MRFLWKVLKGLAYVPRVLITDKLTSDGAAQRDVLPSVEHRRHKGLNNRAENAHQPTRERERRMRRFKSPGHVQRFLAASGPIAGHFRPCRHRLTVAAYRQQRDRSFACTGYLAHPRQVGPTDRSRGTTIVVVEACPGWKCIRRPHAARSYR